MHIETLRAINGIGIFPVISLVLFVTVFVVMLVRTARIDQRRLAAYSRLPFDDGRPSQGEAQS